MSELPSGWTAAALADLIGPEGIFSDGDWVESKDQDPSGAIRLLQLADVGDGVFVDKSNRFVNDDKFEQLRCTEVFEGDVLIARMPDPLGRACLAPKLRQRCITVVDVAIVRPGPSSVRPRWLMHFLNAPPVRQIIELQSSGTTRRRISRGKLALLELPVPPLAEQKRIADKLDALLARVDACRAHLDRVPGILRRFRQSVLAAATSGELTREWREVRGLETDGWSSATVGQLIEGIDAGLNVQCEERPPADNERGLVKISAVTWGTYDDNESKTLPPSAEVTERSRIRMGDFLISRANTLELVGACVIVHRVTRPVFLSDKILRLVMPEKWKPWLLFVLQSPEGRRQIEARASGNQLSMRNLSQASLRELRVPIPLVEERAEIVLRVVSLLGIAAEIERQCTVGGRLADKLTSSVLAKAFRGELVPTEAQLAAAEGREYESASALLERCQELSKQHEPAKRLRGGSIVTKRSGRQLAVSSDAIGRILRELGKPLTPKELFDLTGFSENTVDEFYEQLRGLIHEGTIRENRPNGKDVTLEIVGI